MAPLAHHPFVTTAFTPAARTNSSTPKNSWLASLSLTVLPASPELIVDVFKGLAVHQQLPFFSEQWCGRRLWAKTPLDESIGCLAVVVLPSYSKLLRLVTQEPSLLPNSSSLCCTATISSNCASSLDSGIREIALYTKRYIAIQSHNR